MTSCKWILFCLLVCAVGCGPTGPTPEEKYNTALEILEKEEAREISLEKKFRDGIVSSERVGEQSKRVMDAQKRVWKAERNLR